MTKLRIFFIISVLVILIAIFTFYPVSFGNTQVFNSYNPEINYFSDDNQNNLEESNLNNNISQEYDVVVVGGDPEGVAAAVSAARNGATTLLIEERDGLGGLLTYGMLNQLDLGYDVCDRLANQGIFKEWFDMVGGKGTFNIKDGKDSFMKLVENEKNITLMLNVKVKEVIKSGNKVTGVLAVNSYGEENKIYAKRFIDTTANADFAVMSEVSYFIGQEDIGIDAKMCATLVIVLEDVDWKKFKKQGKKIFGGGNITKNIAWGFKEVANEYLAIEENTKFRGLNIGLQDDGVVTINALQIFGVDGLDDNSVKEAIEKGKRETENFLIFLQENFPGFEQAQVAYYPSELYIRETRHILAEYQLSITDVWENNDQWDSVALASYPVDVQAASVNGYGYYVANPIQYAIPFRSLVPIGIDSLLVASRSAGYSSLTAGSARTVPIGMSVGQAAGAAATLSIKEGIDFREMSCDEIMIGRLQDILVSQNTLLYSFDLDYPYKGEWYYPAIKKILPSGLLIGGYNNNLNVDNIMTEYEFLNLLGGVFIRSDYEKSQELFADYDPWLVSYYFDKSIILTRDNAVKSLFNLVGISNNNNSSDKLWEDALNQGIIDREIFNRINKNQELTRKEGYYLIAYIFEKLSD